MAWKVLRSNNFSIVYEARIAQVTFAEKPQMKIHFISKIETWIFTLWDKVFKGTFVNGTCHSINGGSLGILRNTNQ